MFTRGIWGLLAATTLAVARPDVPAAVPPPNLPGASLPVVKVHRYRMSGHIRPLLFWISRDDVGDGRLAWRLGADGSAGWDFVLGTDPARAPRRLNRWGYIAEEAKGRRGSLFAMMSSEDEDSLGEVNDNADRGATGGGEFKAVRARVGAGVSEARVSRVRTPRVMTIGEVDELVVQAQVHLEKTKLTKVELDDDVRPGFLVAVAELVDANVRAYQTGAADVDKRTSPIPYVFGDKLYSLVLASTRRQDTFRDGDERYAKVVRAKFEIRTQATGDRTDFELVYGLEGELAGVPVLITFQPRWWLRVQLHLDDDRQAAAG